MASKEKVDDEDQMVNKKPVVAKTAIQLQRMRLEKLMENPEKLAPIPSLPKEKRLAPPPEFNRNVMGSSAGAGSGEFHVYRHIRRREYARQKYITEKATKEDKDADYHAKLEANKAAAEAKTAKKRAKRLRKKANRLQKKAKTESEGRDKPKKELDSDEANDDDSDDGEKSE